MRTGLHGEFILAKLFDCCRSGGDNLSSQEQRHAAFAAVIATSVACLTSRRIKGELALRAPAWVGGNREWSDLCYLGPSLQYLRTS